MDGRFYSYLRVSTGKQGQNGLGIEAQREAVTRYLNGGNWTLCGEYVEVESGKVDERPQLAKALAMCALTGATLVVAKLDRLSRNQAFLMSVYEGCGEGGVVFCDLPSIPSGAVGKFIVQQMASVAELERGLISQRTKAALQAAKARGVVMGGFRGVLPDWQKGIEARQKAADGFANRVAPMIHDLRQSGLSLDKIARKLEADGIKTAMGGKWTGMAVKNVLDRVRDRVA